MEESTYELSVSDLLLPDLAQVPVTEQVKEEFIQQVFYNACKDGDIILAQTLLSSIKNLEFKINNCTPLYIAAGKNKINVVKLLIKNGCNINSINGDKLATPLHVASINDYYEIVELLLDAGADIKAIAMDGNTALHYTAVKDSFSTFELLFGLGASIDILNKDNESVLDIATAFKSNRIIDIIQTYKNHQTKRFYDACYNGNIQVAKELIDSVDINFNSNGLNPLYAATYRANIEIIELLLKKKCNVDIQTKLGWTALHVACINYDIEIIKMLLFEDCDLNLQNNDGETPLHCMLRNTVPDVKKMAIIFKMLVEAGADLTIPNKLGETVIEMHGTDQKIMTKINNKNYYEDNQKQEKMKEVFMKACIDGNEKVVAKLAPLLEDINFEVMDKSRKTWPLNAASYNENQEVIDILLAYKCDLTMKTELGYTVLHTVCGKGEKQSFSPNPMRFEEKHEGDKDVDECIEIVKTLIDAGCDINAQSNSGNTPLHFAVFNNATQTFKLLLDAGGDVKMQNIYGFDVLQKAVELKRTSIIKLIEEHNKKEVNITDKSVCKTCKQKINEKDNLC